MVRHLLVPTLCGWPSEYFGLQLKIPNVVVWTHGISSHLAAPAVGEVADVDLRRPEGRHVGHVEAGPGAGQSEHGAIARGPGEVTQRVHDLREGRHLRVKSIFSIL